MTDDNVNDLVELDPKEQKEIELGLRAFVLRHETHHRPIAIVTSGGTAADLELNSVRCLDNFSTGLRGAISVEEFLKRGYAVIHLWRVGSASPFGRILSQAVGTQANHGLSFNGIGKLFVGDAEEEEEDQLVQSVLDSQHDPWLTDTNPGASPPSSSKRSNKKTDGITLHRRILNSSKLQSALSDRKNIMLENRLYTVPFRSVDEYLAKLQLCAESVRDSQSLAMFYLAAAVSDFYVPKSKRSEHKIQSAGGGLTLELAPVPKVMGLLRSTWAPDAFVCSFKLETDREILRSKAERAVQKYNCHMVVGNLLHSRHQQVSVLAPSFSDQGATMDDVKDWPFYDLIKPRNSESDALESMIVETVVQTHFEYISSSNEVGMDRSGTQAVIRANDELSEKRRKLERDLFWEQVKTTSLEWAGVAAGCLISYAVSSALRNRMTA
eukprot:CAMPEP_0113623300 /NCGR_PEP_ID=MMETSP0017_2-20120614/11978_1 /TAXON_ID=2856 /ORGANISM="Cylindrotheca closterium" /LENGTH=438 /DNA_ID=CAMNT_0000533229 /DNA_START=1939 /DNA_END=3255 /DNA_ORIENTATION=+ /assembly_acc=CAM_ASM_000147